MIRKNLNKNHKIGKDQAANLVPSKNNTLELAEIERKNTNNVSSSYPSIEFSCKFLLCSSKKKENKND